MGKRFMKQQATSFKKIDAKRRRKERKSFMKEERQICYPQLTKVEAMMKNKKYYKALVVEQKEGGRWLREKRAEARQV